MEVNEQNIGPNGRLLMEYWKSLATGESIPSWDDIKISGIAPIASRVVVFEIFESGGAKIVFSGNEIDLRLKREVMGGNTQTFGTPDEQLKVLNLSRGALLTPCGTISDFLYRSSPVEPIKRGVNLVLPLLNAEGDPRILILTDDWLEDDIEDSVTADIEGEQKKSGYITMIDDLHYIDLGFGLPPYT